MAGPSPSTPGAGLLPTHACVRCEILPVACAGGGVVHLRRCASAAQPPPAWWAEPSPGLHPTQAVVRALAQDLEGLFDPSTSIVHSTSWRYEPCHGTLVLSYVVVLQPPGGLAGPPPGFEVEPVEIGHTHGHAPGRDDPSTIRVADVLAHGLHHFALLRFTDPVIAGTLSADWHRVLARWHPLPAGLHDHYTLAASSVAIP
ncbi:MAG: hypothetical protein ACRDTT_18470 [Pseudonocardiaceae bacterium]